MTYFHKHKLALYNTSEPGLDEFIEYPSEHSDIENAIEEIVNDEASDLEFWEGEIYVFHLDADEKISKYLVTAEPRVNYSAEKVSR